MPETFSVCQFFDDALYEYVRRNVTAEEAMNAFAHYTQNVASRIGITKRVIVTDSGDSVNAEWLFDKGYTFPPELVERMKQNG